MKSTVVVVEGLTEEVLLFIVVVTLFVVWLPVV